MNNKRKTTAVCSFVTSGDSISVIEYGSFETYRPSPSETDINLSVEQRANYGGVENKVNVSTPVSRARDRIENLNKRLKNLG